MTTYSRIFYYATYLLTKTLRCAIHVDGAVPSQNPCLGQKSQIIIPLKEKIRDTAVRIIVSALVYNVLVLIDTSLK